MVATDGQVLFAKIHTNFKITDINCKYLLKKRTLVVIKIFAGL